VVIVRPKGGDSNADRREQYMEAQRRMTALRVRLSSTPGTVFPDDGLRRAVPDGGAAAIATLARLEAGGPAIVSGSQVGLGDDETYCLEGDGSLVPVEEIYVDPDAHPKHILNYRRPDGSLLRPSDLL
jgi:hypothetical protein